MCGQKTCNTVHIKYVSVVVGVVLRCNFYLFELSVKSPQTGDVNKKIQPHACPTTCLFIIVEVALQTVTFIQVPIINASLAA